MRRPLTVILNVLKMSLILLVSLMVSSFSFLSGASFIFPEQVSAAEMEESGAKAGLDPGLEPAPELGLDELDSLMGELAGLGRSRDLLAGEGAIPGTEFRVVRPETGLEALSLEQAAASRLAALDAGFAARFGGSSSRDASPSSGGGYILIPAAPASIPDRSRVIDALRGVTLSPQAFKGFTVHLLPSHVTAPATGNLPGLTIAGTSPGASFFLGAGNAPDWDAYAALHLAGRWVLAKFIHGTAAWREYLVLRGLGAVTELKPASGDPAGGLAIAPASITQWRTSPAAVFAEDFRTLFGTGEGARRPNMTSAGDLRQRPDDAESVRVLIRRAVEAAMTKKEGRVFLREPSLTGETELDGAGAYILTRDSYLRIRLMGWEGSVLLTMRGAGGELLAYYAVEDHAEAGVDLFLPPGGERFEIRLTPLDPRSGTARRFLVLAFEDRAPLPEAWDRGAYLDWERAVNIAGDPLLDVSGSLFRGGRPRRGPAVLEIARDLSPVGLLRMDLPPGGGFRVPVSLVAGEGVYRLTLRDGTQKMVVSTEVRVGAYRDQSPGSPVRLAALEAALARGRGLDVPGAAWLGRAWASLGRFERAARILARTAASGPEDKAVREVLGEVRNRLDELKRPGVQWVLNGKIVGTAHLSKGRAYVPLEDLAQAAGFSTFSFPGGRHTARFGPKLISFEGGSRRVYLNGAGRDWTVPPLDSGGKLMVPVRDLVSLAGGEVFWDPATGSVLITLPGPGLD